MATNADSVRLSDCYMWLVAGVDSDGRTAGLGTNDEAEAVALFWELANTHPSSSKVTFYADVRTLWLDENTQAVTMSRVDLRRARRQAAHIDGSVTP